jgi:Domain of unknown function (DUF4123)
MTHSQIEHFVRRVSSREGQAYAVLDAGRGYQVHQAVRWSARPYQCLYSGQMPVELEHAAPFVVELGGDHHFTRRVLAEGWGQSWGFFVVAPAALDLSMVRRHLRSLLRAKLEDGNTLLFRYYDPRVLRVYLPTCTHDELDTFFGPLLRIIVEDDDGVDAVVFERRHRDLEVVRMGLPLG